MAAISFEFLFKPVEEVDSWLTGLFSGAPLIVALGIALLLGLRHASDPDHLVAVTSLVAADGGDTRGAARLGAWWGLGHASMLFLIGLPLIFFKSELPVWLESGAEKAIGVVIILLAAQGDPEMAARRLSLRTPLARDQVDAADRAHRHLRRDQAHGHAHRQVRSPRQALGIGMLHGLAGTGAVTLLLLAALPTQLEAALALAVFAPMSMVSMAICTTAFAWVLTRPAIDPFYRTVLIPAMGLFGVSFGLWYVGLG